MPREMGWGGGDRPWDRPWRSAFVKEPAAGSLRLGRTNLEGDGQADREHHGGPDRPVLCYSADHYPAWREELGMPELAGGAFGENFTIAGQDEWSTCLGDVYEVGEATVEVSQPRAPCYKIGYRWQRADLLERVERSGRHGWYVRVLVEGRVAAGDPVRLLERPFPQWTVRRAADTLRERRREPEEAAELGRCQALSAGLRRKLNAGTAQKRRR